MDRQLRGTTAFLRQLREDDVLALAEAIPKKALLQNENCILVRTPSGGHLGWVRADNIFDLFAAFRTAVLRSVGAEASLEISSWTVLLTSDGGPWSDLVLKEYLGALLQLRGSHQRSNSLSLKED